MVRASHILIVVCCMVSAAMACAPCSTANLPPALKPCINTKLQGVVCVLFQLLISIVGDVKLVTALVLCILKVIVETLKGLGVSVGSLLGVVNTCYDAAKKDSGLIAILNRLLKDLGKVLNDVLKLVANLLNSLLG